MLELLLIGTVLTAFLAGVFSAMAVHYSRPRRRRSTWI